jgi:hypothetical protein
VLNVAGAGSALEPAVTLLFNMQAERTQSTEKKKLHLVFSVTLFTLGFRLFFIQLQINQPGVSRQCTGILEWLFTVLPGRLAD